MKHTQVKYGVDCLSSLLTQEGHIQSLVRKHWEKLKIEGKHKLLAGHNHLLRNNLWKTQVYLLEVQFSVWQLCMKLQVYLLACRIPAIHCQVDYGGKSDNV